MKFVVNFSIPLFFLLAAVPGARADIFAFNSPEGFGKCLRSDHIVETVGSAQKKQSRYIDKSEIQFRCFEKAEGLLAKEKKAVVIENWIKTANKASNKVNAIGLMKPLVTADRKKCNEEITYDTILDIFSGPKSDDKKSLYQKARVVTKLCLADATFKKDFMEEQGASEGSYRHTNICDVLKSEGLIKACAKG